VTARSARTTSPHGGTATFGSALPAQGKTVTATASPSRAQAATTRSGRPWTTTANIDEKELTGSFTAENKTYDGNVSATIASRSVTGKVGTDDVSLSGGTATFGSQPLAGQEGRDRDPASPSPARHG
jgi:hypothetical protein